MSNLLKVDLSNDEGERHAAQQREMFLQDQLAINQEKYEQGLKQGLEQGLEQGKQDEKIEIAKSLLSAGMDIGFVSKHTGLSVEEIEKLKHE